jgi:uncharacterized protein YbjT (DUF2867 family)
MDRVLVTGATGFSGGFAVEALAALGYDVHAVSRRAHTSGSFPSVAPAASSARGPATAASSLQAGADLPED